MRNWPLSPYPYPSPAETPFPRPRHISGLALLRGVFLSTGAVRSAKDLALVTAGMGFLGMFAFSTLLAYTMIYALGQIVPSANLVGLYTFTAFPTGEAADTTWRIVVYGIRFLAFLIVLRISPVAGYHAAEHKVVNAIEQTGSLDESVVRAMPKEHARCGTNLLPAMWPMLIQFLPDVQLDWGLVVLLTIAAYTFRLYIGWVLQAVFTTKEPSRKQLLAGIESGRQLIQRWQTKPEYIEIPAHRLWVRGMPQVLTGLILGSIGLGYAERLFLALVSYGL